jgi:uncharacterized coiled-coil protein SlyX
MVLCDTSVVDWDAVGALGTWVVGGAVTWVAVKANSISADLKKAEQERIDRAARAMAAGLRAEVSTYSQALERLAERLEAVAKERWENIDVPRHAAAAFEAMRRVELADRSHLAAVLSNLPPELARKVSLVYAVQKKAQGVFANNVDYFREQQTLKHPNRREVTDYINDSATEYRRTIEKIEEVVSALADYLNLSLEQQGGMV